MWLSSEKGLIWIFLKQYIFEEYNWLLFFLLVITCRMISYLFTKLDFELFTFLLFRHSFVSKLNTLLIYISKSLCHNRSWSDISFQISYVYIMQLCLVLMKTVQDICRSLCFFQLSFGIDRIVFRVCLHICTVFNYIWIFLRCAQFQMLCY